MVRCRAPARLDCQHAPLRLFCYPTR